MSPTHEILSVGVCVNFRSGWVTSLNLRHRILGVGRKFEAWMCTNLQCGCT